MENISILILASGASSRMRGADKLLEHVEGRPLLSLLTSRALATGLPVYVTLPEVAHPRAGYIGAAQAVAVPDAAEGMAASLRRGIAALSSRCDGVMIVPADMPEITSADLSLMKAAFQGPEGPILRATGLDSEGDLRAGHPVLFPRRCFAALQRLSGDQGARRLLTCEEPVSVALPGAHALVDLDTPEDWDAWRRSR